MSDYGSNAGLLSFLQDPVTVFAGGLLSGRSPNFGQNLGDALSQTAQWSALQTKMERENRQNELQQLSGLYKILKDQEAQAFAESQLPGGQPYQPNPALKQLEGRISNLVGASPLLTNGVNMSPASAGLLSPLNGQAPTLPAPIASQYSMAVRPELRASGPMPQPPAPQPQQQPGLADVMRAANIPSATALGMVRAGQLPKLYEQINEALRPHNGPAGISAIDPATGEVRLLGGNATPGQVPWTLRNGQPTAMPIQGAAEEVARAEGLKTGAVKSAESQYDLVPVTLPDGRTLNVTRAQALQMAGAQPAANPAPVGNPTTQVTPQTQAARDRTRMQILLAERDTLAKLGQTDPALEREIQLAQQGTNFAGGQTPGVGFVTGQTTAGKVAAEVNPRLQLEALAKSYEDTNKVNDSLMFVDAARRALNGATTTGLFAKPALLAARVGSAFGVTDPAAAADPEVFLAMAARNTMQIIKNLGSGSGISDADREYAAKAQGGDITMNQQSINRLLDIQERAARRLVELHNRRVDQAAQAGVPSVFDYRIEPLTQGQSRAGRAFVSGPNTLTMPSGQVMRFPSDVALRAFMKQAGMQ